MSIAMLSGLSLGAAGCVSGEVPGECMYGTQSISCKLIRECDSVTGNDHWEYNTGSSSGNVNIAVRESGTDRLIGYKDSNGSFIATTDANKIQNAITAVGTMPTVITPTRTVLPNLQAYLAQANQIAQREAVARYPTSAQSQAIYITQRVTQIMSNPLIATSTAFNAGLIPSFSAQPAPSATVTTIVAPITPTVPINTNTATTPASTIPATVPAVAQATGFNELLGNKWDEISGYVQNRDHWMLLGAGLAAAIGFYMYNGSANRAPRGYRY